MRISISILTLCMVIGPCLLSGCGDAPTPGQEEDQQVATVVSGVNDAAGDEETFKSLFVSGNAPEDRSKYFSSAIEVVGTPEVTGDTAKAVVKISQGSSESEGKNSDPKAKDVGSGEVTWTLKKEGETWKIQDAPLP